MGLNKNVLVIDDERRFRELLSRVISLEGYQVFQAKNVREGMSLLEEESISVVVTDVKLPDGNGLQVLDRIKKTYPLIEVIVITAYGTIEDGVRAIKQGAFDYITKGDEDEHIHVVVERAVEKAQMKSRLRHLEQRIENRYGFDNIVGHSDVLEETKKLARKVAPSDMSVLLQGETGTGKELFAHAIHQSSNRNGGPFVALNCSAFPRDLLESELFGYEKGAFTGADRDKKGLLEEADSGTLFLDEVGELDSSLQAKLLRFLENQTFTKLGATKPCSVDVRVLSATNQNLRESAENGRFRDDLYFRLAGFVLDIPPLRARKEDIRLLAEYFLNRVNKQIREIDDEVVELLEDYPWKGNIRELKNVMERAAILAEGDRITVDLLPPEFKASGRPHSITAESSLAEVEKEHIARVLEQVGGNRSRAADILQIGTSTLYRKIKEYGL